MSKHVVFQSCIGIAVIVVAVCVGVRIAGPGSGNAAEWVAAIATALALLAAAFAALYAKQTVDREQDRDERRLEQQERDQASSVAAWPDQLAAWFQSDEYGDRIRGQLHVKVHNTSRVPVSNVLLRGTVTRYYCEANEYYDEQPGFTFSCSERIRHLRASPEPIDVALNKDDDSAIDLGSEYELTLHSMGLGYGWDADLSISFRDSSGIWWERTSEGDLTKLDRAPEEWSKPA